MKLLVNAERRKEIEDRHSAAKAGPWFGWEGAKLLIAENETCVQVSEILHNDIPALLADHATLQEQRAEALAELESANLENERLAMVLLSADSLAAAVLDLVDRRLIDARGRAGDALLNYSVARCPSNCEVNAFRNLIGAQPPPAHPDPSPSLKQPPITWTDTLPSEPGDYYWRTITSQQPCVIEIVQHSGKLYAWGREFPAGWGQGGQWSTKIPLPGEHASESTLRRWVRWFAAGFDVIQHARMRGCTAEQIAEIEDVLEGLRGD